MHANLHPILVHFPIALLSLYAVLELIRFRKILALPYWFYIKALLVIVGALSTIPALIAGSLIKSEVKGNILSMKIIDLHASFAVTTSIVFGILAVGYLIAWVELAVKPLSTLSGFTANSGLFALLKRIKNFILTSAVSIILALIGLGTITITGALGASIVYGPNVDPAVHFIYNLFIK